MPSHPELAAQVPRQEEETEIPQRKGGCVHAKSENTRLQRKIASIITESNSKNSGQGIRSRPPWNLDKCTEHGRIGRVIPSYCFDAAIVVSPNPSPPRPLDLAFQRGHRPTALMRDLCVPRCLILPEMIARSCVGRTAGTLQSDLSEPEPRHRSEREARLGTGLVPPTEVRVGFGRRGVTRRRAPYRTCPGNEDGREAPPREADHNRDKSGLQTKHCHGAQRMKLSCGPAATTVRHIQAMLAMPAFPP